MRKYITLLLPIVCFSVSADGVQHRSVSYEIQGFSIAVVQNRHRANVIVSDNKNYHSKWRWDGANLRLLDFSSLNAITANYCLNAYRPGKGSNVNIYACNKNDPEQHWNWENGWMRLVGTNLCLNSYQTREGSNLNLYPCDRTDLDQKFNVLRNVRP